MSIFALLLIVLNCDEIKPNVVVKGNCLIKADFILKLFNLIEDIELFKKELKKNKIVEEVVVTQNGKDYEILVFEKTKINEVEFVVREKYRGYDNETLYTEYDFSSSYSTLIQISELEEKKFLSQGDLSNAIINLIKYYRQSGYEAKIICKYIIYENGARDLIFEIELGSQKLNNELILMGFENFDQNHIKGLIIRQLPIPFVGQFISPIMEEVMIQSVMQVKQFLASQGYYNSNISYYIDKNDSSKIYLFLNDYELYQFEFNLKINSKNSENYAEKIKEIVSSYNNNNAEDRILLQLHMSLDQLAKKNKLKILKNRKVNKKEKKVEVTIEILDDIEEILNIEKIIINGNANFESSLIYKHLEIHEGDKVTYKKINEARNKILSSGLFAKCEIKYDKNNATLNIIYEEHGFGALPPGINWDKDGIKGSLSYINKAIANTDNSITNTLSIQSEKQSVNLSWDFYIRKNFHQISAFVEKEVFMKTLKIDSIVQSLIWVSNLKELKYKILIFSEKIDVGTNNKKEIFQANKFQGNLFGVKGIFDLEHVFHFSDFSSAFIPSCNVEVCISQIPYIKSSLNFEYQRVVNHNLGLLCIVSASAGRVESLFGCDYKWQTGFSKDNLEGLGDYFTEIGIKNDTDFIRGKYKLSGGIRFLVPFKFKGIKFNFIFGFACGSIWGEPENLQCDKKCWNDFNDAYYGGITFGFKKYFHLGLIYSFSFKDNASNAFHFMPLRIWV